MDTLSLKIGINAMMPPSTSLTSGGGGCLDLRSQLKPPQMAELSVEKQAAHKNLRWGFSFPLPLRSLWPLGGGGGGKNKNDALALDEAVLADEKIEVNEKVEVNEKNEGNDESGGENGNWVLKILHVRSLWKGKNGENGVENDVEDDDDDVDNGDGECEGCSFDVDDDEKIEFDKDSFSRLLKRVSLAEARLYAQMSYLGNLAYAIPQIKPKNLLRNHRLRFITSSFEKKEQAIKAEIEKQLSEKEKELTENQQSEKGNVSVEAEGSGGNRTEEAHNNDERNAEEKFNASAAYKIAASAASYLHSHTKSILPFTSSESTQDEDLHERGNESGRMSITPEEMASLMATTDSVTAVVSAKEEVKQAVADGLSSISSSPCDWFMCDEDQGATRYFVIQGSETLASWQANLLFEPIKFEGLNVLVHRGIYEAAKGIYEQMLPEVQAHMMVHGSRATFRFTGHSLGGSLSLLVNLMLLIRGEVPASSLLPVITFGAPAVMCGGDHLLHQLGLPRDHLQSIMMHRDIVPRAFSCNYPNHIAELLKAVNGNFRNHPCLNKQKLLYAPMGEFLILQPDEKFSPHHKLLPLGSGLYFFNYPVQDVKEAEKQIRAAQSVFLNSPHPLEILSDRAAYGSGGSIQRDHDMNSYLRSIRNVIRQELNRIRKVKREKRRKLWWPLVSPHSLNASIIMGRPVVSGNFKEGRFNIYGALQNGKESFKRFSRLVASQHMHLLVILLFPAKMLILGTYSLINIH
ncbi:hypothetical protein Leryth_009006 [Lithospermum erythrorhizon]|nr:hypothetical protein Leryth_009006 [Lithospermum erythrorhizon]